ncbi:MAG: hypothetical protein V3T59_09150, partial [Desulfobacterales bacterium]
ERSEVEFFNFSAASRRTLQIVPTISSEVQTLVNRNIFMTTGITTQQLNDLTKSKLDEFDFLRIHQYYWCN